MYRDVSVNLSTLKIETNPGKPLEFYVESCVGTLRIWCYIYVITSLA